MKVLLVHNRYRSAQPSGENAVVDDQARLLADAGCAVERVELASDAIAGWPAAKRALLPGRVVWSAEGSRLVREAAARFRPDVVHVHNTFPLFSPAALRAARRTGAAVVLTLHNFRPLCAQAGFLRDGRVCEDCLGRLPLPALRHGCYRGSRAATLPLAASIALHGKLGTWTRSVDLLVCLSAFARDVYVRAGWPAERIAVEPNTAPDPGIARAAAPHGFAYLGRLAPEKGVDVLLAAWARAGLGEPLAIAGAGDLEAALRAAPAAGVSFLGALERGAAHRVLASARALVVPSRWYEVSPRVVLEAFALGVPVVASELGSLPELVEDGVTGLLVPPDDPDALAAALRRLVEEPELGRALGERARLAWERRYAPEAATRRLLALYAEAAARRAAPAEALEATRA